MRNFFLQCTLLTTLLTGSAAAQPAAQQEQCGFWEEWCPSYFASVSFLRWKVCQTGLDYALGNEGAGPAIFYDYDSDTGFRLTLGSTLCGKWGASIEYTDFSTKADHKVGGTFMLTDAPTIPFNGVTVSADLNYKTVDLTLGYCSHLCHDLDLTTFGGLRFLRLDQSLNISSGERSPKLLWNSELDAAGIILGAHTHWTICGPWSLYGVLTGSLLKGDAEANYSNEVNGGPFHEEECLGILGSNISAGISYSSCLFSVPFDVSVGYEGHYWNNLPVRRRVANGIATPGTGGYLLLHGWELRIDACF